MKRNLKNYLLGMQLLLVLFIAVTQQLSVQTDATQQGTLEKYLQVEHYPTYILFRSDGTRATAPDQEPRPYDPQAVRSAVLEAMGE